MQITVRLFASLAETAGWRERVCEVPPDTRAGDAWQVATGDAAWPDRMLCAVNFEYRALEHPLAAGDEVAFFPPVTGG